MLACGSFYLNCIVPHKRVRNDFSFSLSMWFYHWPRFTNTYLCMIDERLDASSASNDVGMNVPAVTKMLFSGNLPSAFRYMDSVLSTIEKIKAEKLQGGTKCQKK